MKRFCNKRLDLGFDADVASDKILAPISASVGVIQGPIRLQKCEITNYYSAPENSDEPMEIGIRTHTHAMNLDKNHRASIAEFFIDAHQNTKLFYTLHLKYAAIFEFADHCEKEINDFLHRRAPIILFPFAQRLVADLTRESGFPPIWFDPADFGL